MNSQRGTILGQLLVILSMILVIYSKFQDPDITIGKIFGIEWLIVIPAALIVFSVILIVKPSKKKHAVNETE
jgi:prolipoprotein diacylglyceryltransferase